MEKIINKLRYINTMKNVSYAGIFVMLLFFNIFLVSAVTIDDVKQFDNAVLYQTCNNCTYCNITNVKNDLGNDLLWNTVMLNNGSYYYTILNGGNTTTIGTYTYCYDCGNADESQTGCIDFEVTSGSGTTGFYWLVLLLSLGVIVLGFYMNDAPMTILGSLGLYFVGLYILYYGIDGVKDAVYTWAIGIIILMLAAYISIRGAYELITN